MSLHCRLFGLPCVFCGRPVYRLNFYVNAIVTQHEPGYGPDCVHWLDEPPAGGAVEMVPHAPAPSAGSNRRAAA